MTCNNLYIGIWSPETAFVTVKENKTKIVHDKFKDYEYLIWVFGYVSVLKHSQFTAKLLWKQFLWVRFSDPATDASTQNTSSKKLCLESSQDREPRGFTQKCPKEPFIYISAATAVTSRSTFTCKSMKELVTALQGYLNVRPGGEVFTQQELLPA